jgi:hypothetical protein
MTKIQEMIDAARKEAEHETEFKREVFLAALLKRMLTDEGNQPVRIEKNKEVSVMKKQSIKEFLLGKKPKTDVEKVLAMGYFLETQEGLACFNVDDLRKAYVKSKEPIPGNINDKINLNIKKGLITEVPEKKDNKKAYHLTATGERSIEEGANDA